MREPQLLDVPQHFPPDVFLIRFREPLRFFNHFLQRIRHVGSVPQRRLLRTPEPVTPRRKPARKVVFGTAAIRETVSTAFHLRSDRLELLSAQRRVAAEMLRR